MHVFKKHNRCVSWHNLCTKNGRKVLGRYQNEVVTLEQEFNSFFVHSVSPIPEITPSGQDSVSAMCQQLSRGLSLLSSSDDYGPVITHKTANTVAKEFYTTTTTTTLPGTISL